MAFTWGHQCPGSWAEGCGTGGAGLPCVATRSKARASDSALALSSGSPIVLGQTVQPVTQNHGAATVGRVGSRWEPTKRRR